MPEQLRSEHRLQIINHHVDDYQPYDGRWGRVPGSAHCVQGNQGYPVQEKRPLWPSCRPMGSTALNRDSFL